MHHKPICTVLELGGKHCSFSYVPSLISLTFFQTLFYRRLQFVILFAVLLFSIDFLNFIYFIFALY